MTTLAELVDRYLPDLVNKYGNHHLPGYYQALHAFRRCLHQHSRVMVLECGDCHNQAHLPHSCGHRMCPRCQHHKSQQFLEG
jgi:hypothetical protein